MKRGILFLSCCLVVAGAILFFSKPSQAADFRIPVGLSYVSGFDDIGDAYEKNLEQEGYRVESTTVVPVGLSVNPYLQLNNGIRFGAGFGPLMLIMGDRDLTSLPVNATIGYTFPPSTNISGYIRGGISHQIASGDYVRSSSAGLIAAIGIEFFRSKKVGLALEFAHDESEIEIEENRNTSTTLYQPSETTISIHAIF